MLTRFQEGQKQAVIHSLRLLEPIEIEIERLVLLL